MNRVFHVTNALAVLALLSASEAASATIHNSSNSTKTVPVGGDSEQILTMLIQDSAKKTFQEIRELAIGAASDAAGLKARIQSHNFSAGAFDCPELVPLKAAVNQMGKHVLTLEADRQNLTQSQRDTLHGVLPLLQHATTNVTKAIEYAKENPSWLAAPENQAYVARIERDARQIIGTIDGYLKAEKARTAAK